MSLRRTAVTVLAIPVAMLAAVAWAIAGQDPAAEARKVLEAVEAQVQAPAPGDAGIAPLSKKAAIEQTAKPLDEAKKALARAKELRGLGDVGRAELAEDLALEWALAARETLRAVEAETDAVVQAKTADELEAKADKARKLLEEAIARRAKLQADLDALDRELEERALDAGAKDAGKNGKKKKGGKP